MTCLLRTVPCFHIDAVKAFSCAVKCHEQCIATCSSRFCIATLNASVRALSSGSVNLNGPSNSNRFIKQETIQVTEQNVRGTVRLFDPVKRIDGFLGFIARNDTGEDLYFSQSQVRFPRETLDSRRAVIKLGDQVDFSIGTGASGIRAVCVNILEKTTINAEQNIQKPRTIIARRVSGSVTSFWPSKKYGFIRRIGAIGKDIYVHVDDIKFKDPGARSLRKLQPLEFDIAVYNRVVDGQGFMAVNVTGPNGALVLGSAAEPKTDTEAG